MSVIIELLTARAWSPYAVGAGIGVLSWLTFLLSDHPLGISTAFARTSGMIERAIRGPKVNEKPYYQENKPTIDWEWMLVVGLFAGALTSALASETFQWAWVPDKWQAAFGGNILIRQLVALAGGICVGFGARWGCGCTSGHGISGTMQLVVSSWLSAACFFIGGVASALTLYRLI